ncbi:MAG TPA: P-loop NTPase fold protein [Gammaproteobacteria bacterium]|nr:P-loop NTPase fold protein [Gammaproteobacteria bacterium]
MFDADRPITKSEQDRLGRSVFAKYLARCILDHQNPESLVIGLYGSWGTGKTSIINLTLEELRLAAGNMLDIDKPVILNFSPWSYSGQQQLIYSFFRRLSSEIQRSPFVENSDRIIELLELYVSFFTHKPVPRAFRPKHSVIKKMIKPHATKEEAFGWESGRDLTHVKAELNEILSQQKHKIIIFIDNIAQIEDGEIKQIFQIVKSMGDYANTVYVLSMDKKHIIHAMNNIYGHGGVEYLEKIVQLPFNIPEISKQDLENILLDRLYQIVKIIPENSWDKSHWADLYYSTIKYFFKNCRDITHYVNTLSFSFSRVKELVNPVDFFAITTLAVFSPRVYAGIRDNKDLFTDFISNVFETDQDTLAEDKLRCDEIINRAKDISPECLLQLLIRLFPRLRNIYQTQVPFYHSEDLARRDRRICSADVFDIYFRLSLPSGYMSEPEISALLRLTNDVEAFSQTILRLNKDERILQFLDLLDSFAVNKIDKKNIPNVIETLLDSADLFPEGENNPLSFNTPMRVHRITHQLFARYHSNEERFAIFRDAIKKSTMSLFIFIHELRMQTSEIFESDQQIPSEEHDFSLDQLDVLKKLTVSKIIYWSEIGRLAEHPKLIEILYAWKEWGNFDDCKRFVGLMVQEDKGLLAFLLSFLKIPIDQAMTKLTKNPEWENALRQIEDFIFVGILEPHAKMMFEDISFEKLREREQLAILIFLDLIHAETVKIMPKVSD